MQDNIKNRLKYENASRGHQLVRWRMYSHFDLRIWKDLKQIVLKESLQMLAEGRYRFSPLIRFQKKIRKYDKVKRKVVDKPPRDIMYASHNDALVYSRFSFVIAQQYELFLESNVLDKNVIWYRSLGNSNVGFAKEVFDHIDALEGCIVLTFDVKKFFDTLSHAIIKKNLARILWVEILAQELFEVYKSVTKYHYIDVVDILKLLDVKNIKELNKRSVVCDRKQFRNVLKQKVRENKEIFWIPQWTPISALISNVYMIEFDMYIKRSIESMSWVYRRYADDIIIVIPWTDESIYETLHQLVQTKLAEIKLQLSIPKTECFLVKSSKEKKEIKMFNEGGKKETIDYLGLSYNWKSIYIKSQSVYRYYRKATQYMKRYIMMKNEKKAKSVSKKPFFEAFSPYKYFWTKSKNVSNFITYWNKAYKVTESKTLYNQIKKVNKNLNRIFQKVKNKYFRIQKV